MLSHQRVLISSMPDYIKKKKSSWKKQITKSDKIWSMMEFPVEKSMIQNETRQVGVFFVVVFLGLHLRHIEVPRLGVKSEL